MIDVTVRSPLPGQYAPRKMGNRSGCSILLPLPTKVGFTGRPVLGSVRGRPVLGSRGLKVIMSPICRLLNRGGTSETCNVGIAEDESVKATDEGQAISQGWARSWLGGE